MACEKSFYFRGTDATMNYRVSISPQKQDALQFSSCALSPSFVQSSLPQNVKQVNTAFEGLLDILQLQMKHRASLQLPPEYADETMQLFKGMARQALALGQYLSTHLQAAFVCLMNIVRKQLYSLGWATGPPSEMACLSSYKLCKQVSASARHNSFFETAISFPFLGLDMLASPNNKHVIV